MDSESTLVLDRGSQTSCSISLTGASIVSWRVNNVEQLFSYAKSDLTDKITENGGLQIIFPQFGSGGVCPDLKGFARYAYWRLLKKPKSLANGDIEASFVLTQNDLLDQPWSYDFSLSFTVVLKRNDLILTTSLQNTGEKDFNFHLILSGHFKVADILTCAISGIEKCKVVVVHEQPNDKDKLMIKPECTDKIFLNTPDEIDLVNTMISEIQLKKTGFPDVVVGNPWLEDSAKIDANSIAEYVVIGIGIAAQQMSLAPGKTHEGCLQLHTIEAATDVG